LVVLALPFGGADVASAQTKVSIANLIISPSHLPLWIAHERGLFAKQGIDAQILIFDDAPLHIAGDIQFGVIGIPAAILLVSEGREVKVLVSLDTPRATGHLITRREIKTPVDLRGKRFGVNRIGAGVWIHSMLALNHLGLDPKRDGITFVEIPGTPQLAQALEAGQIDAVVIDPGQSAQLRAKGFSLLLDLYSAEISGVQSALVVTGDYLRERPDVVEKVVAALIEGIGYSLAPRNEEIVRNTLMTRTKISTPAAADIGYQNFLSRANRKPYASVRSMQNLQRVMALNDPKVLNVRIADIADDRYVRKLDENGAIDQVYQNYGVK
jgi:ABC-type nitrate/sulfonate/bicarbonate transport system substrate-binding protein